MPLTFNLRQVEEDKNLELQGDLPVAELGLAELDEMIHTPQPLRYDLEVQRLEHAILVRGTLELDLACECVRCLKPFSDQIRLEHWACHMPLTGDDKVQVQGDSVDLTPYIREDMVLAFPQHPLCKPECDGLASTQKKLEEPPGPAGESAPAASTWAALDKLEL